MPVTRDAAKAVRGRAAAERFPVIPVWLRC